MFYKYITYVKSIVTIIVVAVLFSCSNISDKVEQSARRRIPQSETYNFELVYTESGNVRAILKSNLNEDFSNAKFPYSLFPNGVNVLFYDDKGNQNTVTSKFGIIYHQTQMVELKDSVELILSDGRKLQTEQLIWDQRQDWIFTENKFTITDTINHTITRGQGMDFDKNVSLLKAYEITGILPIKQDDATQSGL